MSIIERELKKNNKTTGTNTSDYLRAMTENMIRAQATLRPRRQYLS